MATFTSVHHASAQFSYNYSNRLDSMLRRASLTEEYDFNDLTVEDNKGNSDCNPIVKESKLEGNGARYKAPCMPCNLVTTARVGAMLQRLDHVSDDDDDLDLIENTDNTRNGTPFR